MAKYPPVAIATDAVLTAEFYSMKPMVVLITRKHEPFLDKFVFPGGHFDAGTFREDVHMFTGGDVSLRHCCTRENFEETGKLVDVLDWVKIMDLDASDRDPRGDARRVAHAYWHNFEKLSDLDGIEARDDAATIRVTPLMDLKPGDMGFDHWKVIDWLQKKWRDTKGLWTRSSPTEVFHFCLPLSRSFGKKIDGVHLKILWIDGQPRVFFQKLREELIPTDDFIAHCPFCGALLTHGPIE